MKRQQEHRKDVIARREEKQREALRREFEGLGPGAPEGFVQWCEEVPLGRVSVLFLPVHRGAGAGGRVLLLWGVVQGGRNSEPQNGDVPRCGSRVEFYSLKRFAAGNGIGHTIRAAVCQPVAGAWPPGCFRLD